MKDNFEFDKIILAIALSLLTILLSNAIGGFVYRTNHIVEKSGFKIEITSNSDIDSAPKGLPEVIEIGKLMASGVIEAGKNVFNKCAVCHTNDKGGGNKVGPNLWGIVGAKVTHLQNFNYSEAMTKRGQEGKTWTYEDLYRYIYAPKSYVPGNKMAFAGIKNTTDIVNLISYLRTLSDNPVDLPKLEN